MEIAAPSPPSSPPAQPSPFRRRLSWVWQQHWGGSLFIIVFTTWFIAAQVSTRVDFASTELADAVESRWGAPVEQAAPSVRSVESGTVFTELTPLALAKQHVRVDAQMNYRKRGLAYFSGFDFIFDGAYAAENKEKHDIDVAFVFPVEVDKSQVLLSELSFEVNGQPAEMDLGPQSNRLVWTGRLAAGSKADFRIRYRARGLESFIYRLDPSLPAHDVALAIDVTGGDNFDYPDLVLAANQVHIERNHSTLEWKYPSLESGVAMGIILPSMKKYDSLLSSMAVRAIVPGSIFLIGLTLLGLKNRRPFLIWESYVAAAAYGFTTVLLAYLGAFMHFFVAWSLTMMVMGAAMVWFLSRIFPAEKKQLLIAGWFSTQVIPTFAVLVPGFTGLIYTLELLVGLLLTMLVLTQTEVRHFLSTRRLETQS